MGRSALPDVLRYDRTARAAYPTGRALTDDVYSMRFAWLTRGTVTSGGLKPHDDLLAEFPYLGGPIPEIRHGKPRWRTATSSTAS